MPLFYLLYPDDVLFVPNGPMEDDLFLFVLLHVVHYLLFLDLNSSILWNVSHSNAMTLIMGT